VPLGKLFFLLILSDRGQKISDRLQYCDDLAILSHYTPKSERHLRTGVILPIVFGSLGCYSGDNIGDNGSTEAPVRRPATAISEEWPLAQTARTDLAKRLGIDEASIELIRIEEVTWPDGGLGCPRPGMAYTQALVNGSLIVLRFQGVHYEYHTGPSGEPFYCAHPQAPLPRTEEHYGNT
jgi:hypothetical protein